MKVAKLLYQNDDWTKEYNHDGMLHHEAQLVLGFGDRYLLSSKVVFDKIKKKFPNAQIALCSSSGEIFCNDTYENSVSIAAIQFDSSTVEIAQVDMSDYKNSYDAGVSLMKNLSKKNLKWVFVLSDGSHVNGSELVKGLNKEKPEGTLITGGLAGDSSRFEETLVGLNDYPSSKKIVVVGVYGDKLQLSHASLGGWETFGLERTVTKSSGNKLYEIDGKDALELYRSYLGVYANELPGSALLFPLSLKLENKNHSLVRTILSINEKEKYMVFAGDLPEGSKVRFMRANFDRLIDAANLAATECLGFHENVPKLVLHISCVGRKLVLGNRISEEIDEVTDVFGKEVAMVGFYSYGEISPLLPFEKCELHNQTITITGINEII